MGCAVKGRTWRRRAAGAAADLGAPPPWPACQRRAMRPPSPAAATPGIRPAGHRRDKPVTGAEIHQAPSDADDSLALRFAPGYVVGSRCGSRLNPPAAFGPSQPLAPIGPWPPPAAAMLSPPAGSYPPQPEDHDDDLSRSWRPSRPRSDGPAPPSASWPPPGCSSLAGLPAGAETPTLHRGPGLLLEDRDGRIYAAVPGPAAVVIRGGDEKRLGSPRRGPPRGPAGHPRRRPVDGPRGRGPPLPAGRGRPRLPHAVLPSGAGRRGGCWPPAGETSGAPGAPTCGWATPCSRPRPWPRRGGRSRRSATTPSATSGA